MKDSLYSNPTRIATKFNNFFANVGPSLATNISPTQITYREFLIGHHAKCFYLNLTSPTEAASNVMTLPCFLTIDLFLFSPVFPRCSKNSLLQIVWIS